MRALRGDRGAVLPFVALLLVVILGMAAFAIDLSVGYQNERRAQTAADAAALAGVQDLPTDPTAAQADAQASVNTNLPGATATITTPYNGNSSEMKVTVTTSSPAFFAKIFGVSSLKESATAAAQVKTRKPAAFFAADTSCTGLGITFQRGNGVTVTGGMRSDGALNVAGGSGSSYDATTYGGPNHCADNVPPGAFPAGYPQADPTDYPWPIDFTNSAPACTYSATSYSWTSGSIPAGVYCATTSITVTNSGGPVSGNVTFIAPTISIAGNNNNLTPYSKNLLIYQTGSTPLNITGNNMQGGWIFAPNAQVVITGNNGTSSGFVEAQDINVTGNNWTMTGNGPNVLVSAALIL